MFVCGKEREERERESEKKQRLIDDTNAAGVNYNDSFQ